MRLTARDADGIIWTTASSSLGDGFNRRMGLVVAYAVIHETTVVSNFSRAAWERGEAVYGCDVSRRGEGSPPALPISRAIRAAAERIEQLQIDRDGVYSVGAIDAEEIIYEEMERWIAEKRRREAPDECAHDGGANAQGECVTCGCLIPTVERGY